MKISFALEPLRPIPPISVQLHEQGYDGPGPNIDAIVDTVKKHVVQKYGEAALTAALVDEQPPTLEIIRALPISDIRTGMSMSFATTLLGYGVEGRQQMTYGELLDTAETLDVESLHSQGKEEARNRRLQELARKIGTDVRNAVGALPYRVRKGDLTAFFLTLDEETVHFRIQACEFIARNRAAFTDDSGKILLKSIDSEEIFEVLRIDLPEITPGDEWGSIPETAITTPLLDRYFPNRHRRLPKYTREENVEHDIQNIRRIYKDLTRLVPAVSNNPNYIRFSEQHPVPNPENK